MAQNWQSSGAAAISPALGRARIGVLGGGQLGRMLLPPALRFNLELRFLDPDPQAPCAQNAAGFVAGRLDDFATVTDFGRGLDLLTIEIEHVNAEALAALRDEGLPVRPGPELVALVQDKLAQKEFYQKRGIPTAEFAAAEGRADLPGLAHLFPAVQKLRRGGFDGRGVVALESPAPTELERARAFDAPSVVERKVNFSKELAVIVSRSPSGRMAVYPAVEMQFHPEQNLVELLFSPADVPPEIEARAAEIARETAEALRLEGLLAVELFLTQDDELLVNEIAPRPHNSGHHTIEACVTSQYEQHLRAILDLPPGATDLLRPAVMVNLLGAPGLEGPACYEGVEDALALPGVAVHLYGKRRTRPFRKMGHVTITASELPEALRLAREVRERLRVTAEL